MIISAIIIVSYFELRRQSEIHELDFDPGVHVTKKYVSQTVVNKARGHVLVIRKKGSSYFNVYLWLES